MNLITRAAIAIGFGAMSACSGGDEDPNVPGAGGNGPYSPTELAAVVEYYQQKHGLPAMGVLVQQGDEPPAITVSGVRKLSSDIPVEEGDLWHIGSTAKAMTATLLATYVQDGAVEFETTLLEIYPELVGQFTEDAKRIKVSHLLNHTSGVKANPFETIEEFQSVIDPSLTLPEQRLLLLRSVIAEPVLYTPGSDFTYSNTGYILAGAVIERLGGKDFETLLSERVFQPLGIVDFGFGAPGNAVGPVDQPWGHRSENGSLSPVAPGDTAYENPSIFNSAGNLHINLRGWAAFARDHLRGLRGQSQLLDQSLIEQLSMPISRESGYSLGWGVLVENNQSIMLTHNGSDGSWFADIRLYPHSDITLLMVTNDGREDGAAKAATSREFRRSFNRRYQPYP